MSSSNMDFQKLDFTKNNHSVIYAPNATGKTRLTIRLAKKYADEQAMFFTSATINDMLSFSGRKIYVGSDSHFKLENDNIVKEYNRNLYGDYILKRYDVKNASSLVKSSCLFNCVNLKRKDTFEIYSKLVDFLKDGEFDSKEFELSKMIQIDKMLSKLNLENIKRIVSDNVKLSIEDNEYTITKELKEKLQTVFDSISTSKRVCPLCGHEYDTNRDLKNAINNMLKKYIISSDANDYETCIDFLNVLDSINNVLGIDYFITKYNHEIETTLLFDNLNIIDEFLNIYATYIVRQINESTGKELFNRYKENEAIINKEENLRRNDLNFYRVVVDILNELITLPDGFVFRTNGDKVEIVDSSNKTIDPKAFLSESEQRRMCIAIVFAEIKQRQLQYIVFDDPVDSNDDYYFDISANVIGDLLLTNQTLNWMILTHEFRLVSILSERCRLSEDEFSKNVNFLFYLPDPSFSGTTIPPFSLIDAKAESISFLNEHETIIFRKIFSGQTDYQCDKDLALLSSFNTARNLYNDIIKNHRITKHKLKKLEHAIATGNMSYEHYKSGNKRIMRLSTLFIMNKMMYSFAIGSSYFTNSKVYAANYREEYITTKLYSSIKCDNDVLKYILFAMIRVMNSHYLFEKKLAKWASINITSFSCSKFESILMIYNKLRYIESICPSSKRIDFKKFDDCFAKWRGLLNDFAHSASRMIPPYLTISPIEMFKLESNIKRLP